MVTSSSLTGEVRRWGAENTDALLDPQTKHFQTSYGLIGYREVGNTRVIFGDPLCKEEDRAVLAESFAKECKQNKKSAIYVFASESFAKRASQALCPLLFEVGEKLILDPAHNPMDNQGVKGSLVRRKVRHALKEEVSITEYQPHDAFIEKQMEELGQKWVKARKGLQVHISNVHIFEHRSGKRWFYATHQGKIMGMLILNRIEAYSGWLLNHLMVVPEAPSGTSELLVIQTLNKLREEGCRYLSLGAIAKDQIGEIKGLGIIFSRVIRGVFALAKRALRLEGLQTFWGKFQPETRPVYLLFSTTSISLTQIRSLMKALGTL